MKFITKIQSISDIITNSSSEVFVMRNPSYYEGLNNGCIFIEEIDWDWILNNYWEYELICEVFDLPLKELVLLCKKDKYGWLDVNNEKWESFIEPYKEQIVKELPLYFVDIEDHFENAYEVNERAESDSIWYESRH